MRSVLDTHTRAIVSAHTYSIVAEMARTTADRKLEPLAIMDRGPALADSNHKLHFTNYHMLPGEICGVRTLYGVELNILDSEGNVDLDEGVPKRQDLCITSFHTAYTKAGTMEESTQTYLEAMENLYADIIRHPEDGYTPMDFKRLVKKAKEQGILLEINNSSIKTVLHRLSTRENMKTMLELCKQCQVSTSMGTDAHYASTVGLPNQAPQVLREVDFPEGLVTSTSTKRFLDLLAWRRKGHCLEA